MDDGFFSVTFRKIQKNSEKFMTLNHGWYYRRWFFAKVEDGLIYFLNESV